jgi:hypothetical protein
MSLFKNFRVVLLLSLLIIFTCFLVSPYLFKKSGVVVTSVDKDSRCGSIKEGDVITNVLGSYIKNSEDFKAIEKTVKANEYATMIVNDGPGGCTAINDGYFGLVATDIPSKEIKFGIDIQGGVTSVLKPGKELNKTEIESVVQTLNKRISIYGLPEATATASDSLIKINSLSIEKISWLTANGKFEAKIMEEIKLEGNTGKIPVGDNTYSVELANDSLKVNGSFYRANDKFELENVEFNVKNITNSSAILEATVFENRDIVKVLSGAFVSYNTNAQAYEFSIPVEISDEASNRFTKVIKRIPTTFVGQQQIILNGFLVYYLDGDFISRLSIPIELTRQKIKQISVVGFSTSMTDASDKKSKILGSIVSGILPTSLEIIRTEKYEPKLKVFSVEVFGSAVGLVVIFIVSVFYWRYRNLKFGIIVVALALLELVLVLGTIAITQQLIEANWTINLTTIVGFVVVLIISSIQMIMSSEQTLKKRNLLISYRYKKLVSASMVLNLAVLMLGSLFLFSAWRFFGLTLLTGLVFDALLIKPIYKDFIKKKVF